jgi:hypothetical protein
METANLNDLMGEASQQVNLGLEGDRIKGEQFQTKLTESKSAYDRALRLEELRRQKEEADRQHQLAIANSKKTTGGAGGTGTPPKGTPMSLGDSIKDLVMSQGLTWDRAAGLIEQKSGKKIASGSDEDVYLKYYFGLRERNPGKYMNSADLQRAASLGLTKG